MFMEPSNHSPSLLCSRHLPTPRSSNCSTHCSRMLIEHIGRAEEAVVAELEYSFSSRRRRASDAEEHDAEAARVARAVSRPSYRRLTQPDDDVDTNGPQRKSFHVAADF
eukprot:TRINITY_DN1864_c0_g2_i1.p3 TRINITY_DN1864_c0_g2~~TRINITY_DN1864_c0_g2_i1.p3  ORF type:complete len:109 (-),score=16.49 TRINITY_DN1864_c0_g2_i1:109-435(-)